MAGKVNDQRAAGQLKSPAESKEPWDYFKLAQTIPGEEAYTKLANSKCPLVKK